MSRQIVRARSASIKIGVANTTVASVRSTVEEETAVRLFENGCVGLASACGRADEEALTKAARDALSLGVAYDAEPEGARSLSWNHEGAAHDVASLVALGEEVLDALRSEYPQFVFSHGLEHSHVRWDITSDEGLDLHYERRNTDIAFIVKEKGSGNIFDTFVALGGHELSADVVLARFRRDLTAYANPMEARTGRQRVVFPGFASAGGSSLLKLFRTDLTARPYAQGASAFDGKVGDGIAHLNEHLTLFDARDPERYRVCPFDMDGVVRTPRNLDVVSAGRFVSLAANKRDAARFGLPATGTAAGDASSLSRSGFGRFGAVPTAKTLSDLLGDEGGLLAWIVSGADTTRTGDIAMPAQVVYAVDGSGQLLGRVPGCVLTGNLYDVLGDGFVGVTEERVDPLSDENFVVTHMDVQG